MQHPTEDMGEGGEDDASQTAEDPQVAGAGGDARDAGHRRVRLGDAQRRRRRGEDLYPQSAVAVGDGTGSSTWWYVVIAAMVVFGLTLAGAAIIRRTDRRRQLAGLAH